MSATVIGIAGHIGAGKDTLAAFIQGAVTGPCRILTFADPIRDITDAVGLRIFERDQKEVLVTRRYAFFADTLIEAINGSILGELLSEGERADLFAYMMEVLQDQKHLVFGRQDRLTITPRRFAELLGTEAGRRVEKGLWVRLLRERAKQFDGVVIVPDVRFMNERDAVDLMVGIRRKGELVSEHASAKDITALVEGAHIVLENNSTVTCLESAGRFIAKHYNDGVLRGDRL